MLQDETSSRVWVCTSAHSSTKVVVLDATQPSDLLDSFYACNTHVVCIASVPGRPRTPASFCFQSFVSWLDLSSVIPRSFRLSPSRRVGIRLSCR